MIISGGVNIYPQEAENILVDHPEVVDVAVFGVPTRTSARRSRRSSSRSPCLRRGRPRARARAHRVLPAELADVKCPRSIDFREELPRHPTGKLYKRLLKDEYWAGHQSRII